MGRAYILCLVLMVMVIENLWTANRYRKGKLSHILYLRTYNDSYFRTGPIVIGFAIIIVAIAMLCFRGYSEFFVAMMVTGIPFIAYGLTYLPGAKLKHRKSFIIMPDKQLIATQFIQAVDIHPDHLSLTIQVTAHVRADHLEIKLRDIPDIISYFDRVLPGIPVNIHIQAP